MHLIALNLKKKFNLPWVADFRDPWTGINYFKDFQLTKWAFLKHQQLEKKVLRNADKVVVVSEGMKKHFNEITARDYEVITNGFDEDDAPTLPITPDKKFTIAHIGTLSKTQNPQVLWEVLKDLTQSNKDFASNLEIKLVGYVDVLVMDSIQSYGLTPFVHRIPYLPHDEVISEQYKSHVLLLVINNAPNSGLILTGKFFEYMASRRPILCIGPKDGDAAKIIEETQCGFFSGFEETDILKNIMLKLYNDFENGGLQNQGTNITEYSRLKLTERFSGILNSITGSRTSN
jgi:glycosyltransferase involved in cell wall biosynthesis